MNFNIRMGIPEMSNIWERLKKEFLEGSISKKDLSLYKKWGKSMKLLSENPRHPGLHTHDIEELTLAHPIETVRGRYGGGVRVADGYYLGRKYLKPDQQELLKRLSENLTGEDLATMNSILSEFALTKRAEK